MVRKIERRTVVNRNRRSSVRTAVKNAEVALGVRGHNSVALSYEEAQPLVVSAESKLMRGAQKGVFKKKSASRKVSRLVSKLKTLK